MSKLPHSAESTSGTNMSSPPPHPGRERKKWLSRVLGCSQRDLTHLYEDPFALDFLLTWSTFETKCFGKDMQKSKIENCARQLVSPELLRSLDTEVTHFHQRYQDKTCYRHLKHRDHPFDVADRVLSDINTASDEEKLAFLIYVVYRFRNNMFHGNKGLQSWLRFKDQIEYCISAMAKIVDRQVAMKRPLQ